MAQIGRVCVDRLSAGLLPRLSKAAICIFQHRRKFISGIFFSHLPLFREHSVFPFLLHAQGRRYRSCGCFLLFMYTRLYILPSKWQFIHHSLFVFPSLFPLNWVLLSSAFSHSGSSLSPPTHPCNYHCITHHFYSQRVEATTQRYRRWKVSPSCLFSDWFFFIHPSQISSAALRTAAKVANFWNRRESYDIEMLTALPINHQGLESASNFTGW